MWKFFDSSGAEKVIVVPRASLVTALPSNPTDGDEIILTDSLTAGTYHWHFRYVAARSSNKWIFVGGPHIVAEVTTSESTASTTYTDLATPGPSVTIPVAGSYRIHFGCWQKVASALGVHWYTPKLGSAATSDTDGDNCDDTGETQASSDHITRVITRTLAASDVVKMQYKTSAGTSSYERRWLTVIPVAVGG